MWCRRQFSALDERYYTKTSEVNHAKLESLIFACWCRYALRHFFKGGDKKPGAIWIKNLWVF